MNYPTISEYVQAVKFSEDNFDKLSNLSPILDSDGNMIMSSGNFAVVFKMEDKKSGKQYAVKCFLRDQEGRDVSYRLIASELEYVSSSFLTPIQYLEKELFVDTKQGDDTEFPVLLMDWVEGVTLDRYVKNNIHDKYKLSLIVYQFCRMCSWLLNQEFAHGDLKPENIMVREDGQLVLVDYDGMFVPAMKGQKARELGSVDYRHPLRNGDKFDATIDDFSIASIALSLKAISLKPELLNDFGAEDRLLLSAKDYLNIEESECLKTIQNLANDTELSQLLGLFYIAYARNELSYLSYKLYNLSKPQQFSVILKNEIMFCTKVTEDDLVNAIEDKIGIKYDKGINKILKAPMSIYKYEIHNDIIIIGDNAFSGCSSLQEITIPNSVTTIGMYAFSGCSSLQEITIPNSVTTIGMYAFKGCSSLRKIIISNSVTTIETCTFSECSSLQEITIPSSVTTIGMSAFKECSSLRQIVIPNSVTTIGMYAFKGCSFLEQITIPNSVTTIGMEAFSKCNSFREVYIPDSITNIEKGVFSRCPLLQHVIIPKSVKTIGDDAFSDCFSLEEVIIPHLVTFIGIGAFSGCASLQRIIIPDSVVEISISAFNGCSSIKEIIIPDSVTTIGDSAFSRCSSLQKIVIPPSVTNIGYGVFNSCSSLKQITIPDSVTIIDDEAFSECRSLEEIIIPNSVRTIGNSAFSFCSSINQIIIPSSVTTIRSRAFLWCSALKQVTFLNTVRNMEWLVFESCKNLQSITVPKGKITKFKDLLKKSGCDISIIIEKEYDNN